MPALGEPQPARTVYRIGVIHSAPPPVFGPAREVFLLHLRELGWREGQNVVIEDRFSEGKLDRLPTVVTDLLRLNVNVIVANDTPAAKVAKEATQTVPIVIATGDPVRMGLIASLARPGGNITGVDVATTALRAKSLQLLREVVPKASHIGFLLMPDNPGVVRSWQELNAAAPSLGVKMLRFDAREPADIDRAFALMASERPGGLVVPNDPAFASQRQKIVDLAAKTRLPVMYPGRHFVEAGGLMSYGNDYRYVSRLIATYVDRILRGAKPADLPVERPMRIELVINMRAARALGIQLPRSLVARADEVIQ